MHEPLSARSSMAVKFWVKPKPIGEFDDHIMGIGRCRIQMLPSTEGPGPWSLTLAASAEDAAVVERVLRANGVTKVEVTSNES